QPQPIPFKVTVAGTVENEAVHYYRLDARKGQRISAEVEGMRLGRALFDPFVAIMNSGRFVLASSDDTALLLQDPACSVIAPEDGPYIIQVRESSYGGNGTCHYRLHVGSFPRPTGVFPAGGKTGETLTIKFLGDVGAYRFGASKGQVIGINAYARRLRSPLDSVLNVYDANGNSLAGNDDGAGPDSFLQFTAPAAGDFLLRVSDHLNKGGADFFYRLYWPPG